MDKKYFLTIGSGTFYSSTDEDLFFEWIKRIPFIKDFKGVGKNLFLYFNSKKVKFHDLRELLALFYRYKINMTELAIFLNKQNKEWFYDNKHAYWHKKVFGSSKKNSYLIDKK
jgi:hypothetical protein